jgi:biopolymer transport protein ExbD
MKRKFGNDRGSADFGSSMTPMIDVVFLLLVFFVWTYSSQAVELLLPSRLSSSAGSEPPVSFAPQPEDDFEQLVIRVEWTGTQPRWKINDAELPSIAEVRVRLQTIHAIFAESRVIIDPEANVPLGHVIEVFDVVRQVGFAKVSLAAERYGV